MKRYLVLLSAFLLIGCSSPEVSIESNMTQVPILSVSNPHYMIDFQKIDNAEELRINLDLINTNGNEYSYTISDVVIVTDDGRQLGLRGLGDECEAWKKVDLSIPRSLYPDARTTYKLCFPHLETESTFHLKVKSKDKSGSVTDDIIDGNMMGTESEHKIELGPYLELALDGVQATLSIEEVKLKDGAFELLIQNNDLKDYDRFYLLIIKENKQGKYSIPVRIDKKIVQGRYIRLDTAQELIGLADGKPYELKNILIGDEFRFILYSGYHGDTSKVNYGLYGELGSESYSVE